MNRAEAQALAERKSLEAEVARLRESRVAQLREIERLEQRAAELERERDNWKAHCHESDCLGSLTQEDRDDARAAHEATKAELRECKEVALRNAADAQHLRQTAIAAEQRVAELEAYGNDCCARAISGAARNHLHRISQLEQRVAELEAMAPQWERAIRHADAEHLKLRSAEAALSSARKLLERLAHAYFADDYGTPEARALEADLAGWLETHPEPATPALKPLALVEDRTPEQLAADGDSKPREPRCECQLEEGDSPCPVHGLDEPATPAAPGAEPSGGVCWHCMVHLEPEEPPHCEQCPRYDCCDEAGCEEPGCTDRVAAEKEQGT